MIEFEKTQVVGWEAAIRGMRNPMNSWERSDSLSCMDCYNLEKDTDEDGHGLCLTCPCTNENVDILIGQNDLNLMMRLAAGGSVHAKYRRMIDVYVDITAPLYWWKEFDTYKVGTVANSCSTMHKIQEKLFAREDFSCEHLFGKEEYVENADDIPMIFANGDMFCYSSQYLMDMICDVLNLYRTKFLETKDKKYWWQMIQLLPSSYNQKRTVKLNYEVLADIYPSRKNHKLDEWHRFCKWIEALPYSEVITGKKEEKEEC